MPSHAWLCHAGSFALTSALRRPPAFVQAEAEAAELQLEEALLESAAAAVTGTVR
jgi:hypothetical protein